MHITAKEEILNYWNGLRGNRPAPLRSELDPSALRHFLPHLFILTAPGPNELIFALAGTRVCELFDKELRGLDFSSIWLETAEGRPVEIAENILLYERPALLDVHLSPTGGDHPYDLLMMPLRSTGHGSDRILGALVPRSSAVPDLLIPVHALSLQNWAFLEPNGSLPRLADAANAPTGRPAPLLRRLIGSGLFAQAGR